MSDPSPRLVILDTDPGVDDALALLYLQAHPCLRLLALTTVFGNADVATTTRNALYLKSRFGLDAPVHGGAGQPLARARGKAPAHVHGANGLGDIDLEGFDPPSPDPRSASEAIIEIARSRPGEVTLVAIGPLTNLALALRAAPDIAGLVAQVVVMGGAFGTHGRNGNVTPFAEANIYNDPEAAAEVLAAEWPLTVVPLDATLSCLLTRAQIDHLAERGGQPGRFAKAVSQGYTAAYARHQGLDGCVLHDGAALAWLTRPELFETRLAAVDVSLANDRLAQTMTKPEGKVSRLCMTANGPAIADDFVATLLARA